MINSSYSCCIVTFWVASIYSPVLSKSFSTAVIAAVASFLVANPPFSFWVRFPSITPRSIRYDHLSPLLRTVPIITPPCLKNRRLLYSALILPCSGATVNWVFEFCPQGKYFQHPFFLGVKPVFSPSVGKSQKAGKIRLFQHLMPTICPQNKKICSQPKNTVKNRFEQIIP